MTLDELDRLAAELVMGFEADADGYYTAEEWHPTRNIAQAWECLEKMNAYFSISEVYSGSGLLSMYCVEIEDIKVYEKTAQLAIVKAVLKAKGVECD